MGFGDLASGAIIFIAVLLVTTGISTIIIANLGTLTQGAADKQLVVAQGIKTDLTIDHVYFDTNTVHMYVKNTGLQRIPVDQLSVFVNNQLYTNQSTNLTRTVLSDTATTQDSLLDANEVVYYTITNNGLTSGVHEASIVTSTNNKHTKEFSI